MDKDKVIQPIDEIQQLANKVKQIEQDNRYSYSYNSKIFFRELIKEIQNKKDYINFVAVLFGVTGIFLNINKEVDYIKNIQVLLLVLSLICFIILSFKILLNLSSKLLGDIGGSLKIFYAVINAFLIYNICRFIWLNYANELWELFKYVSLPLVLLFFNIFVVALYRWNKKKNVIKNLWFIEYLFINIIAFNFWSKLSSNNLDLLKTIYSYSDVDKNVFLYNLMLSYILDAFGILEKIKFVQRLRTTKTKRIIVDVVIFGLPLGLYYSIKFLVS